MSDRGVTMSAHSRTRRSPLPHILAGGLALLYAWLISRTPYVTTGVQFVSPLAVIMVAHMTWMGAFEGLRPGYARTILGRALTTAIGIAAATLLAALHAPEAAEAQTGLAGSLGGILAVFGCLAVLTFVILAAAALLYGLIRAASVLWRYLKRGSGRPPGGEDGGLFDLASLVTAFVVIGLSSLEGLAAPLSFPMDALASSSVRIAASPALVWREVGVATSPDFPLPAMLRSIPRPVAVLVDEGAMPGARRVVRFQGREGEGDLVLRVIHRTEEEVVFQVASDTSPLASWIRQKSLTFRVESAGVGSRLTVSYAYDRLLSPAWFFDPYIRLASFLAVDVLARDTKQRAERH